MQNAAAVSHPSAVVSEANPSGMMLRAQSVPLRTRETLAIIREGLQRGEKNFFLNFAFLPTIQRVDLDHLQEINHLVEEGSGRIRAISTSGEAENALARAGLGHLLSKR